MKREREEESERNGIEQSREKDTWGERERTFNREKLSERERRESERGEHHHECVFVFITTMMLIMAQRNVKKAF